MSKHLTRAALLAVVLALPLAASAQSTTSNLHVTASIGDVCAFENTHYDLDFGGYDFIGANASSPLNAATTFRVRCTSGFAAVIKMGQGQSPDTGSTDAAPSRRMSDGGTNHLAYALYQDGDRAQPWGNTLATGKSVTGTGGYADLTVYGQIPAGQNQPNGNYSDLVLISYAF